MEKCPSIRPYVRTSTIKRNAATCVIHRWIGGDETNRTVCYSRSSEVKVKVSDSSNFEKWPFSTLNNSTIYEGIPNVILDLDTMGQYLNFVGPDFSLSLSFSFYGTSKLAANAVFTKFKRS